VFFVAEIIAFPLKNNYNAGLRSQDPMRRHSNGYPAQRDPAAEKPVGLLNNLSPADEHKGRLHYGPAKQK
jgi:hypothetical protein